MNAKTAKMLKQLEEMKKRTEQLRQQVTSKEESNMLLKKQVSNLK